MDVYLLCDIFLTFRNTCFDMYRLDIAQYLTISSYSFDACLFMNKDHLEIDLLNDPEIIGLINFNIRGGYCCLNKKYGKFENFFTVEDKNKRNNLKKNTYCFYLDVNSLYSKAMSENLPYKNIEECTENEYIDILRKMCDTDFDPKNSDVGYWFLVDFKKNNDMLQNLSDQYPLAFENVTITNKHLSPYTKTLLQNEGKGNKFHRLIGHHDRKENYLVTGENLHLYLKMGMEVEKIHRIFKFQQKPFLKDYIDSNIEKRKKAKNDFESLLFKLLNNSTFGKFMSSSLNYAYKTNICTDRTKFNKLIKSEKFKQCHILSNDKVIVISEKKSVKMNFPSYVGFHILEKSKRIVYELIYHFIFKYLKHLNPEIYYTDTDSLIISFSLDTNSYIQGDFKRAYEQYMALINELLPILDTSNFHKNHPLYNEDNLKKYGLLKSEFPLHIIKEFCGLRPKSYSILLSDYMIHAFMQTIFDAFDFCDDNDEINLVVNDTMSAIFYVSKTFSLSNEFERKIMDLIFELVSYHKSDIIYVTMDSRKPTEKIYYDNVIYKNIKDKSSKDDFDYYYMEICKKFNIYLYRYEIDLELRPKSNIYSYWDLLYQKSKTAAGIPFHLRNKMSHKDYYDTLISKNQNNSKIEYNIIKNDKGCIKMLPVKKVGLHLKDVKRYWIKDTLSYAFFSNKIIEKNRNQFEKNRYSDSDIESDHSNCENNDDDNQNSSNMNLANTNAFQISLFKKRIDKYSDLFCKKTNEHSSSLSETHNVPCDNINLLTNSEPICISVASVSNDMNIDREVPESNVSNDSLKISRKRQNPFCIYDSDSNSSHHYIDSDYYDDDNSKKSNINKKKKARNPYIDFEANDSDNNMSDDLTDAESNNSMYNDFIDDNTNVKSNVSDYYYHLQSMNKR